MRCGICLLKIGGMMSNMTIDDIKDAISLTQDERWFIETFEITIEDLVERFTDIIVENKEEMPRLLGMEVFPEEYEDRE